MTLHDLLGDAVKAPSSHNTQPWTFRGGNGGSLEVVADRDRALPVADPDDRELTISCGAALFNLRVAAAHAGLGVEVDPLPGADVLARVAADDSMAADAVLGRSGLHSAIAHRHTYRKPFLDRLVDAATVTALRAAAEAEGASLEPVTDRDGFAALVAEGDRTQFADPAWRRELASWVHRREAGDGLQMRPLSGTVIAHFDVGPRTAGRDARLAEEAPLLAVLTTPGDEQADWLRAGQALERVLLTAASRGLQASFLNQPIQVAALRPRLAALLGTGGFPQVAVRIGHPREELPAAPRRPIGEVA